MRRGQAESFARTAALIAVGAFAVHQLRYLAGYGHAASSELAGQGHGYIDQALPVLAAFVLSALAAGLVRAGLGRIRRAQAPAVTAGCEGLRRRAILFSVAIATVFCFQESLEGVLAAGHPGGIGAVLSHSGWLALPLAMLLGALCAVADCGLVTLERALAPAADPGVRRSPEPDSSRPRDRGPVPLAATPLAFGLARRPPPALLES